MRSAAAPTLPARCGLGYPSIDDEVGEPVDMMVSRDGKGKDETILKL